MSVEQQWCGGQDRCELMCLCEERLGGQCAGGEGRNV